MNKPPRPTFSPVPALASTAGDAPRGTSWYMRPPEPATAGAGFSRVLAIAFLVAAALLLAAPGTARGAAGPRLVSAGGELVPVIVRAQPGANGDAAKAIDGLDGAVVRQLEIINGFTATVHEGDLAQLRAHPAIASVSPDQGLRLLGSGYDAGDDKFSMYNLGKLTGARAMWSSGYTGKGIDVAVIDSGVAPVNGLRDSGKVVHGPDLTNESQNPSVARLDTFGHGTHMAGIIAGRDSGDTAADSVDKSDPFMGIAPDARIISVKVADARGMTDVSQVIAAIDWVVAHRKDPGMNIRVLNLAFGTDSKQSYMIDPLAFAVESAWRQGIVVVTSAGNAGIAGMTLPATDPFVIAVGAMDPGNSSIADDDSIAAFSSRGDGVRNPDIVAPGVHVQSLRVQGSFIDSQHAATGALNSRFFRGSGTSQAAAIVSGSAALLLSQRPAMTPDQVKQLLVGTARQVASAPAQAQGAGAINLASAKAAATPSYTQSFGAASGGGSLGASRGSARLLLRGVVLDGERDIFGQAVNTASLASMQASGSSWSGGTWNGSTWSGSTWSGSTWSGSTWSGDDWAGSSWSGNTWSAGTWSGSSWSGSTWSGSTWSGSTWSGSSWSGTTWSQSVWSAASWS